MIKRKVEAREARFISSLYHPKTMLKFAITVETHTVVSMHSSDCTWLRDMESPIKAHALFLINSRNLPALNRGN